MLQPSEHFTEAVEILMLLQDIEKRKTGKTCIYNEKVRILIIYAQQIKLMS